MQFVPTGVGETPDVPGFPQCLKGSHYSALWTVPILSQGPFALDFQSSVVAVSTVLWEAEWHPMGIHRWKNTPVPAASSVQSGEQRVVWKHGVGEKKLGHFLQGEL
ncbi:hypothetical protein P7K49_011461 [Saguinus oedipus]|uniref:Uncharacterized protein n=1 Tax=Saguinus oedipus TaxID=9490 RepID=A0ABQ9VRB7_SAGOE|nr:hypothetical protein P7K49_011461 [Saguinus oedipus]